MPETSCTPDAELVKLTDDYPVPGTYRAIIETGYGDKVNRREVRARLDAEGTKLKVLP